MRLDFCASGPIKRKNHHGGITIGPLEFAGLNYGFGPIYGTMWDWAKGLGEELEI